jgi:RNA polymerase-binding transcription factor DksA
MMATPGDTAFDLAQLARNDRLMQDWKRRSRPQARPLLHSCLRQINPGFLKRHENHGGSRHKDHPLFSGLFMKHYDNSLAGHFGGILARRETELRKVLDTGNKEELAADQAGGEVQDFKDLAERESQSDMAAMDAARAAAEFSLVLAARRRLRDGNYGQCVGCGKPIDLRRLEALPAAAFCVACQTAGEKPPHQPTGS